MVPTWAEWKLVTAALEGVASRESVTLPPGSVTDSLI
jgi:hypothetical protein